MGLLLQHFLFTDKQHLKEQHNKQYRHFKI